MPKRLKRPAASPPSARPPVPSSAPSPGPGPRAKGYMKMHINLIVSQAEDLQLMSNVTGISVSSLIRGALNHWREHRDPKNPLAFRCMYPRGDSDFLMGGSGPDGRLPMKNRAAPPPPGYSDARPVQGKRPYLIPAEDTQNNTNLYIAPSDMEKLAELLASDFKKHPKSRVDEQARRMAPKFGWTVDTTLAAMRGLDEGYLDDPQSEDEEETDD